jgi:hypothetical protein
MAEKISKEEKKPYTSPRLTVYGDLEKLTMIKNGGVLADGGGSATKKNSGV